MHHENLWNGTQKLVSHGPISYVLVPKPAAKQPNWKQLPRKNLTIKSAQKYYYCRRHPWNTLCALWKRKPRLWDLFHFWVNFYSHFFSETTKKQSMARKNKWPSRSTWKKLTNAQSKREKTRSNFKKNKNPHSTRIKWVSTISALTEISSTIETFILNFLELFVCSVFESGFNYNHQKCKKLKSREKSSRLTYAEK